MRALQTDLLVIGGGPAGLAAAVAARESGVEQVLVLERNIELGGILQQCVHNGFGLRVFEADLTGPEYAARWVRRACEVRVAHRTRAMVLSIAPADGEGGRHRVRAAVQGEGLLAVEAGAIVLAMGCRERPRGALSIPGTRPAGVYTAGTAQRLVNIEGYMPGERVVILGSGDIGMIMARRLTLEGARVEAMLEILPYISGLRRNLVQCIRDYDIPLRLCTTVIEVRGRERVESVVISQVDERWRPVPGTQEELPCDTLLLSVGLVPENELSRGAGVALDPVTGGPYVDGSQATNIPGIYAAGNVVHVYDLVDDVTEQALRAGRHAAAYLGGERVQPAAVPVLAGENVRHVLPQRVAAAPTVDGLRLELRAREPIEAPVRALVRCGSEVLLSRRLRYARPAEMISLTLRADAWPPDDVAGGLTVDIVPDRGATEEIEEGRA